MNASLYWRCRHALILALPVLAAMVSQNIMNLVDTAMVGTLGDTALAAVGLGGFAIFMFQALVLGVGTGVQAMAARRMGAGEQTGMAEPLNAGLLFCLFAGPLLSLPLFFAVPAIYPWLNPDPAVIEEGSPYLQWRVLAITFMGMNWAFRGYWNAVDRAKMYLFTLVTMHVLNIILNFLLIFGKFGFPELGVTGAGMGTAIATAFGTLMHFYLAYRHAFHAGFARIWPRPAVMSRLFRISAPSGIQQLSFSTSFVVLFWIIGQIGTREVAAASVLINIMLLAILPAMALGLTTASLVGQSLGQGSVRFAHRWGWDVVRLALVMLGVLALPMWLVPEWLLSGFIHDEQTRALAVTPMRLVGVFMVVEAFGMILMHALLGAGDAKRTMITAVSLQWLGFLPLAWLVGPGLGGGLLAVWLTQGGYRLVQAVVFVGLWQRLKWARAKA
ncbi:putative MATE family efflux protein [Natronospira proteinivora]|uniref:Multidrug-efflux transporter n=1 Tax=Natronospira proteinivora TaxID=1807133 RepID=A0ABT1G5E7_9GAMM|nr:MATE family efflux transporter [Natronospira proteinivora]MCP1726529.1 putative MATE family efflux protein [Natronospira proteinivora]